MAREMHGIGDFINKEKGAQNMSEAPGHRKGLEGGKYARLARRISMLMRLECLRSA